jgi:RNA polymerase sigma factor (sigma-70 family)
LAKELALVRDNHPNRANFAEVVNEHWTAVYKLLYHLSGSTHDTEDLAQETFLRALNRLESFAAGTKMRAWLLRIASNAFFDQHRKRKRIKQQGIPEEVAGPIERPERSLENAEHGELLKIAMEELSETTRLVFHLRVQEDLSFREIGEIVGSSEEAARWHMHQARSKLMNRLAGKL